MAGQRPLFRGPLCYHWYRALRDDTRLPSPVIVGNCLNAVPISRVFSHAKGMGVRADIEAFPPSSMTPRCIFAPRHSAHTGPLISIFNHGQTNARRRVITMSAQHTVRTLVFFIWFTRITISKTPTLRNID